MDDKEQLQIALVIERRKRRKVNRTPPLNRQTPPSPKDIIRETFDFAEQSYDQLDGEWKGWLEVARKYEHKVPYQDRLDTRHSILLELAKARARDGKPIPELRAYRIASLMVALYWRERIKREVKVCVYNGLPSEPHCVSCKRKPKTGNCAYLAIRPVESLDQPTTDHEGYECRLLDTVADDKALDLDAWLEAITFLLGCPLRLIEVAQKRRDGIPLTRKDQTYLNHYQARELKKYQLTLL